jgi:putative ABC transport system substrate-binding protein
VEQEPEHITEGNKIMREKNYPKSRRGNRWTVFIWAVIFALLVSGCGADKPKVYRVGILCGVEAFAAITDGFKAGMADQGYAEGEDIVYDVQDAKGDPATIQQALKQFVSDEVDLIVAFPTDPALAAKAATQGTDIPVVFAVAGLEGNDLVESVRQPGGKITGTRYTGSENTVKRLEILLELVPQAERVYITYDPNGANAPSVLEALRQAAPSLGVTLVEAPVTSVEEIQANLQERAASDDIGMDAILIMPEILSQTPDGWGAISQFAAEHKVPVGGAMPFTADQGALFSYTSEDFEVGELAASLADKILRGTPAGTIPVVTPEDRLRLNYKAAQELGLTVPDGLLSLATEIIR